MDISMPLNRRQILSAAAGAALATTVNSKPTRADDLPKSDAGLSVVKNGRIRQSIMGWCFKPMPIEQLAQHCRAIGLVAMEGIGREYYPAVRDLGLKISLVGSHGFQRGVCDAEQHDYCEKTLREAIDVAVAVDCPSVITFTGMLKPGQDRNEAERNCIAGWKRVIGYAEEKKINLCLEHLNTRDDTHPMKGHPGYFGDDVDHCVRMIEQIGSPRMKLLFDIYHVQIMNGDVIRRIRQYKDVIGHYHTAGVPGRGELDDKQEVNYPAVMQAILDTGYEGFVAQEFIPTWADPIAALRHAAGVCDV
ncbi:MAG: TIM barrel protein [Planctomycetales bacterium]|nr:TIM barrel protein [Planctomycetales bacterium]